MSSVQWDCEYESCSSHLCMSMCFCVILCVMLRWSQMMAYLSFTQFLQMYKNTIKIPMKNHRQRGLTNSKEWRHSWEVISCSASQEITNFLWNLNVHYHVHKSPPLDFVVKQMNPVHILKPHFFKVHFNNIFLFIPRSPTWSVSFRFHD